MSMVENLNTLKAKGMDAFLASQAERHKCPSCGDVVCVHDGKCYSCGYKKQKSSNDGTVPTIKEAIEAGVSKEITLKEFHKDRRGLSKKAEN